MTPWIREAPKAWDAVVLGGIVLPGKGEIEGLEVGTKWDEQSAEGADGAAFRAKGYEPGSFSIVLTIWNVVQWQDWLTLVPSFRPKPGKGEAKAYPVSHPELEAASVSVCIIKKIRWTKADGPIYTVNIACREWTAKPKPVASSVPTGGWSAGSAGRGQSKAPAEVAVKQAWLRDLQERERGNARTVAFNRELVEGRKTKGNWY